MTKFQPSIAPLQCQVIGTSARATRIAVKPLIAVVRTVTRSSRKRCEEG